MPPPPILRHSVTRKASSTWAGLSILFHFRYTMKRREAERRRWRGDPWHFWHFFLQLTAHSKRKAVEERRERERERMESEREEKRVLSSRRRLPLRSPAAPSSPDIGSRLLELMLFPSSGRRKGGGRGAYGNSLLVQYFPPTFPPSSMLSVIGV